MALPVVRTVHHLSCTGGTLISKCIASMPSVALLSEVHPFYVEKLRFNPFDPVQQLFSQKVIEKDDEALKHIFRERIKFSEHMVTANQKKLVLRDHTHSDYLRGKEPQGFRQKSVINTLKHDFVVKPVLTVRNPIDTFLSLKKNGWDGGVKGFDDYCFRVLKMLDAYCDVPFFRYEDFCEDPDDVLKSICEALDIMFDKSYKNLFFKLRLTGDSGRGKGISEIKPLPPRNYDPEYLDEVERSSHFQEIRTRLSY